MLKDGKIIEFQIHAERGDGDPFNLLIKVMEKFRILPGAEGISWSADGRYAVISNIMNAWNAHQSFNVPVVDVADEEFWMADSYRDNVLKEDGGIVYLSKISRSGEFIYYLAHGGGAESDSIFWFCRCTPDGGNREILLEVKREEQSFSLLSVSDMFEMADGSWLMTGVCGDGRERSDSISLIHFAPNKDSWTATVHPTQITQGQLPVRFSYSADSGYGLAVMADYSEPESTISVDGVVQSSPFPGIIRRVNLMRIVPGQNFSFDIWFLRRKGENNTDLEMASGKVYLDYIASILTGNLPEDMPEGYDAKEVLIHPDPLICNACLSPDGRYALLVVNTTERDERTHEIIYRLYLLDVETMELMPVESPDGILGVNLAAGSVFGMEYRPRMVWNPDGTIVLLKSNGKIGFYRLNVN